MQKSKINSRSRFFTQLILSFSLLAIILISLVGGNLYLQANKLMIDEVSKESHQRLQTSSEFIEQTLLKKYENLLHNRSISTLVQENDFLLNYLLDSPWEGNLSRIVTFRKELDLFKLANEGIEDVGVYFNNNDYAIDSLSFYRTIEHSADAGYIKEILDNPRRGWTLRELDDGKEVLSYAVLLPYGVTKNAKGVLYLDLSLEYIKKAVLNTLSSPVEQLYVLDKDGELLFSTGNMQFENTESLMNHYIKNFSDGENTFYDKENKRIISYVSSSSSINQWNFITLRPMNTFISSFEKLKNQIIWTCMFVLIASLFFSYIISKGVYVPMRRLVSKMRNFAKTDYLQSHANEYAFIGAALDNLGEKLVFLESKSQVNEMRSFLLGADVDIEMIDSFLKDYSYIVCYIHLCDQQATSLQQYFKENLLFKQHKYVVINTSEAAIILYCEKDSNILELERLYKEDIQRLKEIKDFEFHFGTALGSLVQTPEEIPFSYQCAVHAYRYRYFHGSEATLVYSHTMSLHSTMSFQSYETFKNALKAGNESTVHKIIDEFYEYTRYGTIQLETVELGLLQLTTILYQVTIEHGLQSMISPSNLFDEMRKGTLAETIESIREMAERITAHINESENHVHADLIYRLKTYIDDHIHEDLSLNVLSEVASLAPSYISTLFGNVMNESFTEYVTRVRLEKASELLKENKELSVTEISARVGYRNPQYFHIKFKARYGITPVQYRKSSQP